MTDDGEPAGDCSGSALGGAVEVSVDRYGQVVSVRLDPAVLRRLSPDQLGRGVVAAHAEARAATRMAGDES
jgi:DNA-binding protein YbaB